MIVYKLTDADGYCRKGERGETLYQRGRIYTATGEGELCGPGWIHAYEHPILAVLHDPLHGDYLPDARLWECSTSNGRILRDGQLKLGTTRLRVIKEIPLPNLTMEQHIAYAIAVSLRVYAEEGYVRWAENWLSGRDRTRNSAKRAHMALWWDGSGANSVAYEITREAAIAATRPATGYTDFGTAHAVRLAVRYSPDIDLLDCAREVKLIK